MVVVGLVRVSSAEQAEQGISLEAQKQIINDFCEKNGLSLLKIYVDEGQSGSLKEDKLVIIDNGKALIPTLDYSHRNGLSELLADAKNKFFDTVLVVKWDRFSRNTAFSYLAGIYLERLNIKIMAITESNDFLVRDIMSVFAQQEIKKLKARLFDVRKMKFDNGLHPFKCVFGYERRSDDKSLPMVPSDKAIIVKQVFRKFLFDKRFDYRPFCEKYGFTPPIYYNIFKFVDVYAGFIIFSGEIRKGVHEALISLEDYKKIKELLNRRI